MRVIAIIVIESEYTSDTEDAIQELTEGKPFMGCEIDYTELSRKD